MTRSSFPEPRSGEVRRDLCASVGERKIRGVGTVQTIEEGSRSALLDSIYGRSVEDGAEEQWETGGIGRAEADRLIRVGSPTPLVSRVYEKVRDAVEATVGPRVQEHAVSCRRVRRWGEDGDVADVARVLAGDADCWSRRTRAAKRRTFRLAINTAVSAGCDANVFARIAAATCAIADALSRRGYGVELTPIRHDMDKSLRLFTFAPVKRADEPLDVDRVLSLGSPAFLRRVGFALENATGTDFGWGRGSPRHPDRALLAAFGFDYCFGTAWGKGEAGDERMTENCDGFILETFGARAVGWDGERV